MSPTRLTAALAGFFGALTMWLDLRMTSASAFSEPATLAFLAGMSLWMLSPYALLVAAARIGKFRTVTWGAPAVLVVIGFYGNLAYADVNFHFWSKSDAQEALVFLFMPFLQDVVAVGSMGILAAIGYWLAKRKEKGADSSAP